MALIAALLLAYSTDNADSYHLVKYLVLAVGAAIQLWGRPLYRTKLDLPIAIYLSVLTIVSFFSQDFLVNLIGQYQFYFGGIMPCLVLVGLFYAHVGEDQDKLVKSFVGTMLLVSAIGIAQKWGYFAPFELPWGRIYSTIGSPVFLSCLLAMALPLSISLRWYLAIPPLLWALFLTQTRAGHLAAGIPCLIMLFKGPWNAQKWPRKAVLVALGLGILAFGLWHSTASRPMGHTDLGRYHMARIAWKAFKVHPWAGYGSELFFRATTEYRDAAFDRDLGVSYNNCYAHNQFIHALAFTGILGLLAHIFLIAGIAGILLKTNSNLLYPGLAILVYSQFQPTPLHAKAIFAMLLGSEFIVYRNYKPWLAYALQYILLVIAIYLAVLFSADRIRMASGAARSPYMWNQSIQLFPTTFR